MKAGLAGFMTIVLASSLFAQDSHAWAGLGVAKCSDLLSDKDNSCLADVYGQWAWGFYSGLNTRLMITDGFYRNIAVFRSEAEVFVAIRDVCIELAEEPVMIAATVGFDRLSISIANQGAVE
jgi:hypothetical protein